MKFRIKQIDENKFIPQVRKNIFDEWGGIDNRYINSSIMAKGIWYDPCWQEKYCVVNSEYQANEIIDGYKQKKSQKEKYPIYIKVK